jgi:hypothetical protein
VNIARPDTMCVAKAKLLLRDTTPYAGDGSRF